MRKYFFPQVLVRLLKPWEVIKITLENHWGIPNIRVILNLRIMEVDIKRMRKRVKFIRLSFRICVSRHVTTTLKKKLYLDVLSIP